MNFHRPKVTVNGVEKSVAEFSFYRNGEISMISVFEEEGVTVLFAPWSGNESWHDADGENHEVEFEDVTLYANMPF